MFVLCNVKNNLTNIPNNFWQINLESEPEKSKKNSQSILPRETRLFLFPLIICSGYVVAILSQCPCCSVSKLLFSYLRPSYRHFYMLYSQRLSIYPSQPTDIFHSYGILLMIYLMRFRMLLLFPFYRWGRELLLLLFLLP